MKTETELRLPKDKAEIHKLNLELAAAKQAMESFSYSVSHDLRAPLRHILGYLEMAQTTAGPALDDTGRQHLALSAQSARQMGQMLEALMELSRLARVEMRCQEVGLTDLVEGVRVELRTEHQGREIEWQIGELPGVKGDPELLRQVIVQLLSNAIKYTRTRSPAVIQIGAATRDSETSVFIRDNGVGFDMNYAARLFGAFQRFHRLAEFEGTGTGLAAVQCIIQRHGGRTWAESEVDGGTTFHFSIPTLPGMTQ